MFYARGVYVRCRAFLLVASQMQQRAAFVAFRDQRADLERIFMRYNVIGGVREACRIAAYTHNSSAPSCYEDLP